MRRNEEEEEREEEKRREEKKSRKRWKKVVASGPRCFAVRKSKRTEKRVAMLDATAQATGSSSRDCHPTPTLAHWITTPDS